MPLSQNIDWNSGVLRLLSLTLQVATLNLKGINEIEIFKNDRSKIVHSGLGLNLTTLGNANRIGNLFLLLYLI